MSEPAIPAPPGEVSDLQNPQDVLHSVNFATQVVCLVVVTTIVALRLLVKARMRKSLELDDCESCKIWMALISTDIDDHRETRHGNYRMGNALLARPIFLPI